MAGRLGAPPGSHALRRLLGGRHMDRGNRCACGFFRFVLGQQAEEIGSTAVDVWSLRVMLLFFITLFFLFSWRRGGMTLGMQAWRLRVQTVDGHAMSVRQGLIRCAVAWLSLLAFGLGYLWVLFDAERRSWPDIASETRTVVLPKK